MDRQSLAPLALVFFILLQMCVPTGDLATAYEIPDALEAVAGEDGSVWERVNQPGFGSKENVSAVALCPYGESLYALTRNDTSGFEIWKTFGTGWTKVTVPGFTDNNNYYGWLKPGLAAEKYDTKFNLKQNIWGDMIEFNGSLYVAVSTGYQGAQLYGSIGCEIWRFNGSTWQAVVSAVNSDESGTISAVSSCDDTVTYTAQITDGGKAWATDQWAGCIVRVEGEFDGSQGTVAGTPGIRVFDIVSNTADTLTVQQNENAGVNEYTLCAEQRISGDPGRPHIVVPKIAVGDSYTIACGTDVVGFGEMWNKSIVDFEVLNDELYATIGLNYQDGTRIWKTSNGVTWAPVSNYSFDLFHGYDPQGNPTGWCLVLGTESRNGSPVCSSSTHFGKSSVTGTTTLFTGGTGSSGCNGRGARVVRLDGSDWNRIVDYFVDENNEGTNENGFGVSGDFATSNFQAWSWAEYDNLLFVSVVRLKDGSRVMYTNSGSTNDGAWIYSVGGGAAVTDGFGDVTNIGSHLYVFDSSLYAGTISNIGFNSGPTTNGADIWKGTGPGTSMTWTRVTGNGFGDKSIAQFEAFKTFWGAMYVAGSNIVASGFKGDEETRYAGTKVFRLASGPLDDYDEDGVVNNSDNCPLIPNSLQEDGDGDDVGNVCDNCPNNTNPGQEDTYPPQGNGFGDACDCEGNFDCDPDVDAQDVTAFLADFGRSIYNWPCTNVDPCKGDFSCDGDVDATDVTKFLEDFGRSQYNKPCPACVVGNWCTY